MRIEIFFIQKNYFPVMVVHLHPLTLRLHGHVYNTFTLKNIIDYSLGIKEFPERFLQIKGRTGDSYVSDILRSRIIYKSE